MNNASSAERHTFLMKRAWEIYRSVQSQCSCGSNSRGPNWHEPRCALEGAWNDALAEAKDEWYEREEREETEAV